jgi:hypothetical protein
MPLPITVMFLNDLNFANILFIDGKEAIPIHPSGYHGLHINSYEREAPGGDVKV